MRKDPGTAQGKWSRRSSTGIFGFKTYCIVYCEYCNVTKDKKHLDWWKKNKSFCCRTADQWKGNLSFMKMTILMDMLLSLCLLWQVKRMKNHVFCYNFFVWIFVSQKLAIYYIFLWDIKCTTYYIERRGLARANSHFTICHFTICS